jgi:VCBS repeat-containing protein
MAMTLMSEGDAGPQTTSQAVSDGTIQAPNGEFFPGNGDSLHGALSTPLEIGADGKVHVPDADFLYDASFVRSGSDLKLVGDDGQTLLVHGYFDSDAPVPLVAPNDTGLSGDTVSLLAGPAHPGQYAQLASPSVTDVVPAPKPIGKVVEAEGTFINVKHTDGTTGSLKVGDPIFEKDVVDAGGPIAIRFNDGTMFSMTAGSRMVIDHHVYEPDGSSNSALYTVLKGTFSMVGGSIVHTGDMKVATPIATLGIRGSNSYGFNVDAPKGWLTTNKHDPDGSLSKIDVLVPAFQDQPLLKKIAFQTVAAEQVLATLTDAGLKVTLVDGSVTVVATTAAERQLLEQFVDQLKEYYLEHVKNPESYWFNGSPLIPDFDESGGVVFPFELTGDTLVISAKGMPLLDLHSDELIETVETFIAELALNNPPTAVADVVAGSETNAVVEAGASTGGQDSVSGDVLLNDTDPDDDPLTVTNIADDDQSLAVEPGTNSTNGTTITGLYGTLTIGADGSYTYTLDDTNFLTNALAQGQTGSDVFTYTISDPFGATATATITIEIIGTNDNPVISGVASGTAEEDVILTATGTLTSADVDNGATATWSIQGSATGTYGSLALVGNSGEWVYTLNNGTDGVASAVQSLAEGQTVTDTFTVRVTDEFGGFDEQLVSFTITGTNEGPTVDATNDVVNFTEAAEASAQDLSANGLVNFDDIDTNDVVDVTYTSNGTPVWSGGSIDATLAAQLVAGFSTGVTDAAAPGSTPWTYSVNDANLDFLAAGETITFSYTVTATDSQGETATDTVSFTITGTNDVPTGGGTVWLAVSESALDTVLDDTSLPADLYAGMVTGTDPDSRGETDQATSGITFTAVGEAITVSFADPNVSGSGWIAPTVSGLASDYSLSWALNSEGQLVGTLIGPDDVNLGPSIYLSLSGQTSAAAGSTATPTVTVTLTDQLQHALDDVTITGIKVVATDTSGDQVSGDVNVTVHDDVPEIGAFTPGTIPNEVGTLTKSFSLEPGADGIDHFNITGPSLPGVTYSSSTTTVAGVTTTTLTATTDPDGSGDDDPVTLFTLAVHDDGTYTFSLVTPDAASTEQFTMLNLTAGNTPSWTETPDGRVEFSSPSGISSNKNGFGIAPNTFVGQNETFTMEFHTTGTAGDDDPDTNPDFVDAVTLGVNHVTAGGTFNWTATNTVTGASESGSISITTTGEYLIDPTISFNQLQITAVNVGSGNQGVQFSSVELTKIILPQDQQLNFTVQAVDGDGDVSSRSSLAINVVASTTVVEDPIVLDLGNQGIDLSYAAVFDINGDGQLDNVAWTDGQDGMLVMDLDGSGAIENGTEVFSPYFNQGGYTDALAALASLDSNGDGRIDSADPDFANIRVWQDQNQDGVSDAGELKTLADLGITGIDLNVIASSGTVDGQQLLAEGTFTYADGQTGNYIMVALGQPAVDGTANSAIKLDYSGETGTRGVIVNLSNSPVQANIGYGIATAAALTALDTFDNQQALAADVQEVTGTNQADALIAGATGITFDALDGNDNLRGSVEADVLTGGAGDDHITGGGGADTISGGSGTDTVDFSDSTSGISVNLDDAGDAWGTPANFAAPADGEVGGGFADGNHLSGIENLTGSGHDDVLAGNASANELDGGAGNDVLSGEGGDDSLLGGEGTDTLDGGAGNDTLSGGLGDDALIGGPGNDMLDGADGTDTVDYSQDGGPHGVIVNLSDQPISADIGYGASTVAAMSAIDTFGDIDILSGIDNIVGTEYRDVLVGPGNGVTLTGGGGADTFMLTGINVADVIADYNQAEGDTIDLTALYHEFTAANAENGTMSASEFLADHVQYDENTGALSVDMDGDSANGFEQQVATVNEAGSSTSSSVWLHDGISSDSSLDSSAAQAPASVTLVVEDQSATTAIA